MQSRILLFSLVFLLVLANWPKLTQGGQNEPGSKDIVAGAGVQSISTFTISPNPAEEGSSLTLQIIFDISSSGTNRFCLYYPAALGQLTGFSNHAVSGLQNIYTHTAATGPGSSAGSCPLQAGFFAHQWETPSVSLLAQGGDILVLTTDLQGDVYGLFTLTFLQFGAGGGISSAYLTIYPAPEFPDVAITPSMLQFFDQEVGTTSPAQFVTLENIGNANLEITGIGPAYPDFPMIGGNCEALPLLLTPGASCDLGYSFAPESTGIKDATINVESNAPDSPHFFELLGNGIPAPSSKDPVFFDRFELEYTGQI